jgi:hypothetical protein
MCTGLRRNVYMLCSSVVRSGIGTRVVTSARTIFEDDPTNIK